MGFESEQVAVIDHYARHGDQYERRADVGSLGGICGIRPHLVALELYVNDDALVGHREINRFNLPRRFDSKQVFVQGSVLHDVVR